MEVCRAIIIFFFLGGRRTSLLPCRPLVWVNISIELHKITLQGKMEKDWFVEHVVYIELWAQRAEHVHDALIFEGDMQYGDDYMQ